MTDKTLADPIQLQRKFGDRIIKILEPITHAGNRPSQIYRDLLDLIEASLDRMPHNIRYAREHGAFPEKDPPETEELFARLRQRYTGDDHFDRFARAFAVLQQSTAFGFVDVLGHVYMEWGSPNSWAGQFFTPWNVAAMMAEMLDTGSMVEDRLLESLNSSPLGQAVLLPALILDGDDVDVDASEYLFNRVVPAAFEAGYEPVRICDPCVGSGVFLLAAASTMPAWMYRLGLVRFYGCDIDDGCVTMTRINCMLYGLNGFLTVQSALEMPDVELDRLPEPHQSMYRDAQAADQAGDDERLREIEERVRSLQPYSDSGLPLFEAALERTQ